MYYDSHNKHKLLRSVYLYWGHTALQATRSRVRFPPVSVEFFVDILIWPCVRLSP